MQAKKLLAIIPVALSAVFFSGCAARTLQNYSGRVFSDKEVAILLNPRIAPSPLAARRVDRIIHADSNTVVYDESTMRAVGRFRLVPGRYVITYSQHSSLSKIESRVRYDAVELKAGHTYRIQEKSCSDLTLFSKDCRGRSRERTLWIEDEASGEVVAGLKWQKYASHLPGDAGQAILEAGYVQKIKKIDGTVIYDPEVHSIPSKFHLPAGKYLIAYSQYFADPREDIVNLEASNTYRVRNKRCVSNGESRHTVWLENKKNGQILAGVKWDKHCVVQN